VPPDDLRFYFSELSMQTRFIMLGAAALSLPLFAAAAQSSDQHAVTAAPRPYASAASTTATTITLDEAIRLALASNPTLRSATQSVGIADAAKSQAGLIVNPEVSILREGIDRENRTQTLQINQRLELGGKRSARVGVAERERQVALQDLAVAAAQLRADVTAAYFDALIAQERLDLARASVQVAEKATLVASKRVIAGRISPVEQSRSRVAEASVRLELAQALSELGLAKQRLAALWGRTDSPQLSLEQPAGDASVLPPLDRLLNQVEAGPQLGRAREQVAREEAQVHLERAQRVPDLTVTLGSQRDNQIGHNQAVVGLSIPLPLFNRNQGNMLAALRRTDKARSDLDAERLRVNQALNEAYQRAELAQQEIASFTTEILPVAQTTYDAAVTGFEAGKFSFLDVLDAQRTLFQTRAQYLRALSDRYRSVADLGRYVQLKPDQNK
jgi:cobalt-zinc-cadmium efflux system outer membrane protein